MTFNMVRGGVGASTKRPDGQAKSDGSFRFASDLYAPGMLYGRTLRCPHPRAVVKSIDASRARSLAGVRAVLTAADIPGAKHFGLDQRDQPVLVGVGVEARYEGEPVAVVAADHPDTARRALAMIDVAYEPLPAVTDPLEALTAEDSFRVVTIRHGDPAPETAVVVDGYYEVGQQDQAALGPEAGLAVPDGDGGVDLWVATQALHVDQDQVCDVLALPRERCRLHLSGVGGAFGAREDLSVQVHAALLALHCGCPVKMWYGREESFYGHVHRHPALMWYRHGADTEGRLTFVEATIVLDGGAYASSSPAVVANAAAFSCGPYRIPSATVWSAAARTNNPPNGAMRGFGAVQVCFGHESQMDKLAARLGMDPVEIRRRNALRRGDRLITGQISRGATPVDELVRQCAEIPLPGEADNDLDLPGARGNVSAPAHVRRGIGYALGFKNLAFAEGADDFAAARVRLELRGGAPFAVVSTAAVEMGQGLVTVCEQIARTELGITDVEVAPASTLLPPAGSSSASRQTWMTGGAIRQAAREVVDEVLRRAGATGGRIEDGKVVTEGGEVLGLVESWLDEPVEITAQFRHRPTAPLDPDGQGDAHVSIMFVAQRAVVDVDCDAGLVRVVQLATALDVGKAINPLQVHGQIEGGVAQGVGLAVMEEIRQQGGRILNPSFTDYLLPTALDMPAVASVLVEEPEPEAPYGAKGVGEPPAIASPSAVCAAIRDASGRILSRIPVTAAALTCEDAPEPAITVVAGTAPTVDIRDKGQRP